MRIASVIINAFIFVTTFVIALSHFRKDGAWDIRGGLGQFRFFTVLSNDFCAVVALIMAVSQLAGNVPWVVFWLKYLGTAALTLTFLTVFAFLAPFKGGYKQWLSGDSFFAHLVTPVLAILSFCLLERRRMSFGTALTGLLPVLAYGAVYFYKVMLAPRDKRWEDFYGFNTNGKWMVSCGAMLVATLLICVLYWRICAI